MQKLFSWEVSCDMFVNFISVENLSKWPAYLWHAGEKQRWLKSRRSMVAWDSQIKTYVLNIHNIPKIFWGAWPLTTLERPKCSKVWVPLSKLSVSKNVWFTNAILGPLDFIHSETLKKGMGGSGPSGKQPVETTISGVGPPLGATKGYPKWPQQGAGSPKKIVNHNSYLFRTVIYFSHPEYFYSYAILKMAICGSHVRFQRCRIYECFNIWPFSSSALEMVVDQFDELWVCTNYSEDSRGNEADCRN